MDKTRKLRRELGYQVAKLHGLQESVDLTRDDDRTKGLALQVREQAGICLNLLDQYQSSVPSRMWFDAERRCRPLREDLRRTEKLFRTNSGEWDGRTLTRSDIRRVCDWTWEDYLEPVYDSFDPAPIEKEAEPGPGALLAPPRELVVSDEAVETDDFLEQRDDLLIADELEIDGDEDEETEDLFPGPAWRFTLPMDEESPGHVLMVLVESRTGLVYEHRYGGSAGRHREVEGFLVPARAQAEAKGVLEQFFLSDPGGEDVDGPDGQDAVLEGVKEAVRQMTYRGTGDRLAPLELDEARLGELDEAWVPVRTPDGPGYLAWVNAD